MQRKIFTSGNSLVVSLPKEYLELLGLHEGAKVSITLKEGTNQLILTPVETQLEKAGVDEVFAAQVAEFIELYRPALEELARGE